MADGVNLGSAYGEIQIDTEGAVASVNSLASTMRSVGTGLSIGVTAPLVGVAAAAINSAGTFEQSMNVMAQVSGATGAQMEALQAQALSLGATTSFSAGEAAEAMLELSKAGLSPVEVGQAIAGTMDLAAAGNLGLAQAATIAANAINAFQLPAERTADVANLLAAAANASSVDVTDLAQGMQMAGAVFASNGQSVEDLTTALAILGNNAITGSDAGTSLKTMLMRLAAPTDDAAAVMADLGLQVFNADGSMRGFADIVGQLEAATAGLTDQERSMALQTVFGADAIRAATILAREGADGFDEMAQNVNKDGAAAATAGARMKGMRGAIEYLKGSIDSFLITAALPFLDSMSGIVRVVADGISAIGNLPRPVLDAAIAFGAVLAAAGPVMLALSGIATAVGFLVSPVGLLVAGVAAVAAGFVLWQQNFMGIQERAAAFASQLGRMAEAATGIDFDAVADGLRSFANYIGAVLEDGDYLNDWLTHLPDPIQPAVQALGQLVAAFAGLFQTGDLSAFVANLQAIDWGGALGAIGESLGTLAAGMVAAIQAIDWGAILTQAGDWLAGLTAGVVGAIQGIDWAGALTAAGEWLAALRDGVVSAVTSIPWATHLATAGDFLGGLAQGVINRITTINWGALLQQAGDYLAGLRSNVTAALGRIDWAGALATAAGWLDTLKTNVTAAIQGIDWAGALTTAGNVFGGLETAVVGGLNALGFTGAADALGNVKTAVGGLPESLASLSTSMTTVSTALAGFWVQAAAVGATLATFFAPAIGRLQEAFAGMPEAFAPLLPKLQELGGAFGGLLTALQPFVALIGAGLAIAVDFGVNRLTTVISSLPSILGPIIDQVTAIIRLITTILTEVVAGVKAAIDGDWTAVWESAKAIIEGFSTFFRGLFSRLGVFMGAVARNIAEPVINTLRDLGVDITPLLDGVRKTFEDVWAKVLTYIQPVIDLVGTLTDVIGKFKDFLGSLNLPNPFAGLASAADAVRNAIGEFGGGVIEGFTGQPATEDGNAGGTSYFPGGATAINERGYEQVVLPAGSRVYTHGQTNNRQGNEERTININLGGVTVNSPMDARRLGGMLRDQLVMAGL